MSASDMSTLSLHDALPILDVGVEPAAADHVAPGRRDARAAVAGEQRPGEQERGPDPVRELLVHFVPHVVGVDAQDRKSTRLNSSHQIISYAVFCLKKKI